MFFVIDKSKIFSYVVAICTVIVLFVAAAGFNESSENSVLSTAANAISSNDTNNNITNNI
jgi:hypothetical protein